MRLLVRILVCLAICTWIGVNTVGWREAVGSYESKFTPALVLPNADKPLFFDNDCYYWIAYAQRMATTGEWRLRDTAIDNVPYGREMHWSQSIAWLELAAGKIRSFATGESWVEAIPWAAIWVNPFLFAIYLCGLFCVLSGRFGFLPALLAVWWMLPLGDIVWAFHPYRPDHQSLHLLFSLAAFLLLLAGGAGWVSGRPASIRFQWLATPQPPSAKAARCYFAAAGVAGGLALWIGATLQVFCLGLTVAAVLGGAWFFRRNAHADQRFEPGLFRVWSWAGAATSLLLYGVEYFPAHLSLRLEVNHPLYALSWLAGGELLARILGLRFGQRPFTGREFGIAFLLAGLAAVLPLIFLFDGEQVHAMRDREMFRLHEFVNESQPYFEFFKSPWVLLENFLLLPLGLPLAAGMIFFARGLDGFGRWLLWMSLVAAVGTLALTGLERRWVCYFAQYAVVLLAIVLVVGAGLFDPVARRAAVAIAVVVLGAAPLVFFRQQQGRMALLRQGEVIDRQVTQRIMMKRFAVQMAGFVKGRDERILAEPTLAPSLFYFGGLPSTVTFYWENRDGLHAAADFFDASNDESARRIAGERGLTHVLIPARGGLPAMFHYIHTGQPLSSDASNLASRLMKGAPVPAWLSLDAGFAHFDTCFFGGYRVENPIRAWKIAPPGPAPADNR